MWMIHLKNEISTHKNAENFLLGDLKWILKMHHQKSHHRSWYCVFHKETHTLTIINHNLNSNKMPLNSCNSISWSNLLCLNANYAKMFVKTHVVCCQHIPSPQCEQCTCSSKTAASLPFSPFSQAHHTKLTLNTYKPKERNTLVDYLPTTDKKRWWKNDENACKEWQCAEQIFRTHRIACFCW